MKIIKYTKKNKNTYEITLENKEIITIYDELILKYDLLITKELDDYTKKLILEENTYYEAYYKALKYGPASAVVPIDKLSILVTVGFSYPVFKEKLSLKSFIGLLMIVIGTFVMII